MKAALIGYGYWGKIIEKYICDSTYFDLAAVCSPELDNNGIYTKDLEKLMYDPQLEAVFICTPVSTHFDICKKFLVILNIQFIFLFFYYLFLYTN